MKGEGAAAVNRAKTPPAWIVLVSSAVLLALLYWARPVLIPVALSILFTFLLGPIVDGLQKLRLPRVPSVIIVVLLACALLGAFGWMTVRQIVSFANDLPQYRDNITEKIADLKRFGKGSAIGKVQQTVDAVKQQIDKEDGVKEKARPAPAPASSAPASTLLPISSGAAQILELLASAGLIIILVIFMLIDRLEMRNRLIRIIGFGRMNITTKALEEVAQRISRYLLMQFIINGSYGVAIGVSLYLVGLPYPLLWGLFAGLLRFIPYAGVWIGLLVPSALALAVFPGWLWPLIVVGLFLVLELTVAMVLEPLLYGHSAGVSQIALLIAIAFWAWIWGPVGMIMATPMTVCLVVLGKYIPQLNFLAVLMSDEPVMQTEMTYYQRLLASDYDEAAEIVENYFEGEHPPEQVYDQLLLPALYQAKCDYRRGKLAPQDEQFVLSATNDLVEEIDIADFQRRNGSDGDRDAPRDATSKKAGNHNDGSIKIVACPARDQSDALALRMLQRLLETIDCTIAITPGFPRLDVKRVARHRPDVICIGSVAPGGMAQTRHLAKKIRAELPETKIIVGRWGLANEFNEIEEQRKLLLDAGADEVTVTLIEARNAIAQICVGEGPPSTSGETKPSRKESAEKSTQ